MRSNDTDDGIVRIVDHGIETVAPTSAGVTLRFDLEDLSITNDASELLKLLVVYFDDGPPIAPGQRIDWASSLLMAQERSPTCISFGELDFDGETVLRVVDRAVRIWTDQSKVCIGQCTELCPTRFGDMVAISPGVLNADQPVEGIRYDQAAAMSGWWIFTSDYDGTKDDFTSMQPRHVFEVLRHRPEIVKFLGLPRGFAFRMSPDERVWREQ